MRDDETKLKQVEKKFRRWRSTRRPRERIPEELWSEAAALTGAMSVHKVSKRLRLNPTTLKRRAGKTPGFVHGQGDDPAFVEIPWAAGLERVVEIRRSDGAVMTLKLRGDGAADMAVVIRSFLGD
jgi:hypothetical protein